MAIDAFACARDILGATPTSARTLVAVLPPALLSRRPTTGTWSVQDVLAHLRIEQMLAAAPPPAPARDVTALLEEWADTRAANLTFLRALTPARLARTGRPPRYGTISVRDQVIEWPIMIRTFRDRSWRSYRPRCIPRSAPFRLSIRDLGERYRRRAAVA